MQSPKNLEELAQRAVPVARKHGVAVVSLIMPRQGAILDDEGKLHLLLNLDGVPVQPDFDQLARDFEYATGCAVELYTLESIRHSVYAKNVIRQSVILTLPE